MSDNVWRERLRQEVPAFAAKVAPLYCQLGWRWRSDAGEATEYYIPSVAQIETTLQWLIDRCTDANGQISTGGLVVWKDGDDAALGFRLERVVSA